MQNPDETKNDVSKYISYNIIIKVSSVEWKCHKSLLKKHKYNKFKITIYNLKIKKSLIWTKSKTVLLAMTVWCVCTIFPLIQSTLFFWF